MGSSNVFVEMFQIIVHENPSGRQVGEWECDGGGGVWVWGFLSIYLVFWRICIFQPEHFGWRAVRDCVSEKWSADPEMKSFRNAGKGWQRWKDWGLENQRQRHGQKQKQKLWVEAETEWTKSRVTREYGSIPTAEVENGKGFQREIDSLYVNVAVKAFLIRKPCKRERKNNLVSCLQVNFLCYPNMYRHPRASSYINFTSFLHILITC